MEYLAIKQLAAKFAMPERTVYYQIANNKNIRTKKEWRTKLANVSDFAKACGKELQTLQTPLQEVAKIEEKVVSNSDITRLQKSLQQLQQRLDATVDQTEQLQKHNSNLQDHANKFALALTKEKDEKKSLIEKYDTLQSKYTEKIEFYTKRYFLLLGLCFVLITLLLFHYLPSAVGNMVNFK